LPKKGLKNYFEKLKELEATMVFYESPKRILKTLRIMKEVFKERKIVIAREISKIYEEYLRGNLEEIIKILEKRKLKGEITVIFRK
jgi:16S rRNA (cytidine1402-2'-O)-methyltransferase